MPIIKPDLSEAADLSPIPEGTYPGKIAEVKPTKSKNKENMLEMKVKVSVDGKDRTRKTWIMVEGAGAGAFDNLLRAVHMDELADQYKNPEVNPKPDFDTDSLLDQPLNVIIIPELYQRKDAEGNPIGEAEVRDRVKGFMKA